MNPRLSYAPTQHHTQRPRTRKSYALHAMSIAGPEDEQTGDEVEGIHYFDFSVSSGSGTVSSEADPFAAEIPSESPRTAAGETRLNRPGRAEQPGASPPKPPPTDPFEYALSGPPPSPEPSLTRSTAAESPAADRPQAGFFKLASLFELREARPGSRERFVSVFDAARSERGRPFLAIALRMPVASTAALHFPIVVEGVRAELRPEDALLADEDRRRLVIVLPGRSAEEARALLARLRDHLREWTDDAEEVLRSISAFIAPDGQPFHDAEAFLARAFDEA